MKMVPKINGQLCKDKKSSQNYAKSRIVGFFEGDQYSNV
ncbi:hypothetical protein LEP1GSC016_4209 [Leptospira borgpetersenii serovar Hardjo-bovis str. Sponselee]|uniref:Uncharacterized protein n=5 Tax=Leptospira borgpetersenii TaxID=174 RepID=M3HLC0_LEPBO|nr:hypothetical protein LEP1GSC128_1734 [Leptospira borgpetersenii str. 200801926]EKQ92448.1 hypothetical protein LEP1GSC101_2623 [Leptospira borgpetersenii str. UI 09149]EMF98454.1 hypothetical protein LEP1GSC123_0083 [Leptospira borgpetersenii str. 200701203]EMJ78179.1 hypothetical protein LEP1GSC016_4209 [Leptospira borgpetersenii serovar Hardjo-bovis str. Sponselee]EMK10561.1 hypothetical protein LEP1GSC066_0402 [Leptospira sp. serovar Kenya str. Sh9]EMN14717.1 hypothetical protein LEP1GSC